MAPAEAVAAYSSQEELEEAVAAGMKSLAEEAVAGTSTAEVGEGVEL